MPRYDEFCGGSYTSQSPVTDAERTVNWYQELSESKGATSQQSLYPTPGFNLFCRFPAIGCRASFSMGTGGTSISGRTFEIYGGTLFEVFTDGTFTNRGTVAVDHNPATICTNGDGGFQLFITSGGNGYNYDLLTNTLTAIATLAGAATMGGQLYGYFVAFDASRNQIRISNLFDGTTWDPTQFLARTIGADPWTAMLVTPYGQIFLPGSQTGEFLYNAGTFPFPFAPDPSGLIEEGIAATFSVKQAGKSAAWLSTNKNGGYQVMRASGFTPQRISDHALEDKLASYVRVDDCIAETYEDRGHAFLLLTFPQAQATHCYDFNTGRWHERPLWIQETNSEDAAHATFHCFAFNKHLMGDRTTGALYEMSNEFGTEVDGRVMRRLRRAPAIISQHRRLFFPAFEVLLQSGLGLQSGQGSNPLVMMRKSNDFGQTFSNERSASPGGPGQYSKRVKFWATGSGRGRVFEISVTDPTPWRLTDAFLQIEGSTEAA
jgi:hypothetical protein